MPQLTLTDEELRILYRATRSWWPDDPCPLAAVESIQQKIAEAMKAKETDDVETTD